MSDWNRLRLDDCPEENTPDEEYQEYDNDYDEQDDRDFWEHG